MSPTAPTFVEDTLQVRRPSHGRPTLNRRWRLIGYPGTVALAPLCRCQLYTVFAVRGEDTVEPGQVDAGFGHQGSQFRNEVQWFEDHVRGAMPKALAMLAGQAFAIGRLQFIAHLALRRQRQAFLGNRRSGEDAIVPKRLSTLHPCRAM